MADEAISKAINDPKMTDEQLGKILDEPIDYSENINVLTEEPDEIFAATDKVVIRPAVDSGAVRNVIHPKELPADAAAAAEHQRQPLRRCEPRSHREVRLLQDAA